MKGPNLIIITFLLFITDLLTGLVRSNNQTVNCELSTTTALPDSHSLSRQDAAKLQNSRGSPNLHKLTKSELKLVSIITNEKNKTKVLTKEHISNQSLVASELKELKKNLSDYDQTKPTKQPTVQTVVRKTVNSTIDSSTNSTAKKIEECSKTKLDYLVLSLNWPVNICSKRACILNSPQRWFTHNLGYINLQGNLPSHCCAKRPFNTSELGSVTTNELREHMQSVLATKPDESFWFEEWTKFGTCLIANEKLNTIYKYFSETVRLFKEINLESWLKDKNVVPLDDLNKTYKFKKFYQAIYEKRPYKFQVICNSFSNNETNISIIDYVNFCLDNNLNKINCPTIPQLESNCDEDVVFPSLDAIETVIQDRRKRTQSISSYLVNSNLKMKNLQQTNTESNGQFMKRKNTDNSKSINNKNKSSWKNLHDLGLKQAGWISITTKEDSI